MAADAQGNDVTAVAVPVTGRLGLAPQGTELVSKVEGANPDFKLPEEFEAVGLLTTDGGPEWTEERDGDPIEFWQDGYSIPTGLANCTLKFTAAETNAIVAELHSGVRPDANGYYEVNAGGHTTVYVLWLEEIFKNGMIRRRQALNASVLSFKEVKSERGTVLGYEIELKVGTHPDLNNNHYAVWVLNPSDLPEPEVPEVEG